MHQHIRYCGRAAARLCLAASLFSLAPIAFAADGRGYISIAYQQIQVDGFESTVGELDIGTTDTQTISFEAAWYATDKLTLHLGIPLVRKRYNGPFPHRPDGIVPPKSDDFIDDGDYHTDFQDFTFGVSYMAHSSSTFSVEPFLYYGLPSHDYPHFGHAAVGQNLWKVEVGTRLVYRPPLSDFYVRFDPAYTFVEETLGTSVDHWRAHLEVGYRFERGVIGRVFVAAKDGDGLDFPDDFPPPRNTELWYQHDRMVKHNYVNAGIGVDWQFSPKTQLSTSAFTMIDEEQVHIMKYAFSIGVTRYF